MPFVEYFNIDREVPNDPTKVNTALHITTTGLLCDGMDAIAGEFGSSKSKLHKKIHYMIHNVLNPVLFKNDVQHRDHDALDNVINVWRKEIYHDHLAVTAQTAHERNSQIPPEIIMQQLQGSLALHQRMIALSDCTSLSLAKQGQGAISREMKRQRKMGRRNSILEYLNCRKRGKQATVSDSSHSDNAPECHNAYDNLALDASQAMTHIKDKQTTPL